AALGRSVVVSMVCGVHAGTAVPSSSYQAFLLSLEADRTSVSPSPSRSAAATDKALSAVVLMVRSVKAGRAAPLFSYQAILSSLKEADTTSTSLSPSRSAADTETAPSALVLMVCSVKPGVVAPSFSYQAILSSR